MSGKKTLIIGSSAFRYTGQLDSEGNAYGFGKAIQSRKSDTATEYQGTFMDNQCHGICV